MSGQSQEMVTIVADDGGTSRGMLYLPSGPQPKTVTVVCHPTVDIFQYWTTPHWLSRGYAVFEHCSRYVNNKMECNHERLILDVGAVVRFFRESRRFERVVLVGRSGGGYLLSYYQAEATSIPEARRASSPGGDGPDLREADLIPADGLVLLASHFGQGHSVEKRIDPSVIDEDDPWAADPSVDMYEPDNGWRQPPSASSYDGEWLDSYRAAQSARVARIDAIARARIDAACQSGEAFRAADSAPLSTARRRLQRRSQVTQPMVIHRTCANPTYTDPTIEPNDRPFGQYRGTHPHLLNYALSGFPRVVTPHSWLSTWSSHSSYATLTEQLPHVSVPIMIVGVTADNDMYPSEFQAQLDACGSSDKQLVMAQGMTHAFVAAESSTATAPMRAELMDTIGGWAETRFAP